MDDLSTDSAWRELHQPFELAWWREHVPMGHFDEPGFTDFWNEVKAFIEPSGEVVDIGSGPRPPFAPCAVIEPLALEFYKFTPWEWWKGVEVFPHPAELLLDECVGRFDTVICWNCLDHTADWRRILDNMVAYGRPSARFAIATDFHPPFLGHPGYGRDEGEARREFMWEIRKRFNIHKQREPFGRAMALLMTAL